VTKGANKLRDLSLVITDDLLRCDWLGRIGLILTRAVRRLAAYPFGSDWWLHRPRCFGWQVRYLDIYLFYVYGLYGYPVTRLKMHMLPSLPFSLSSPAMRPL